MSVTVELFGIPRQRAGVSQTLVEGSRLDEVLQELAAKFPALAETCFETNRLKPGFLVNLDGDRFVRDPRTPLADGSSLLILSADAGG